MYKWGDLREPEGVHSVPSPEQGELIGGHVLFQGILEMGLSLSSHLAFVLGDFYWWSLVWVEAVGRHMFMQIFTLELR